MVAKVSILTNAVQRRIEAMFPRFFVGSTKHDHYADFGWPDQLTFEHLYRMYRRNGLATAGVDKTILKTWQTNPELWETDQAAESGVEQEIRERFADLRIWQHFAEADRRSMVGKYAGVILRFRDDQAFDKPVTMVPGGLEGLAGVIPVWESQLEVADWDGRHDSETYGEPLFYQFNESGLGGETKSPRQFRVHPDRVLIWSDDGSVNCRSALEPGYNDLIDAEKVKGAGGEGFWKTSRGAPMIEASPEMTPQQVAQAMGVDQAELIDAINEQIQSFQAGFDKGLMLGGMTAKPLQITLPVPEHFFAVPVQSFAASLGIPVKILLGSQTGERASTEDANEWAQTCMSRRNTRNVPLIREFVNRLERFGILPEKDWHVEWPSLLDPTPDQQMQRAKDMAEINAKFPNEWVFLPEEIRGAVDMDPLTDAEMMRDDPEDERDAVLPPKPEDDEE